MSSRRDDYVPIVSYIFTERGLKAMRNWTTLAQADCAFLSCHKIAYFDGKPSYLMGVFYLVRFGGFLYSIRM